MSEQHDRVTTYLRALYKAAVEHDLVALAEMGLDISDPIPVYPVLRSVLLSIGMIPAYEVVTLCKTQKRLLKSECIRYNILKTDLEAYCILVFREVINAIDSSALYRSDADSGSQIDS